MTMHLHHPALSLNGKKKGKRKFRNSDQARESREQSESWKDLLKKYEVKQETRKRNRALTAEEYKPPVTVRRETPRFPSESPTNMNPCTKKPANVYTGNNVIGIAVMHKSCLQPVFSKESAIDSAKMRRG